MRVAAFSELDHPATTDLRVRSANWQIWTGRGAMPVAAHAEVAALLRDGSVQVSRAGALCWQWECSPDGADPEDIVAFRVRA